VQVHTTAEESYVTFTLGLACSPAGFFTTQLQVLMQFYQNGIMRVEIDQSS